MIFHIGLRVKIWKGCKGYNRCFRVYHVKDYLYVLQKSLKSDKDFLMGSQSFLHNRLCFHRWITLRAGVKFYHILKAS